MSRWLAAVENKVFPTIHVAASKPPPPQQPPLLQFVEVDPATQAKEPPKEAKYTGAVNTQAASPKKADAALPQIDGQQEKVLKTTEDSKPKSAPEQKPLVKPVEVAKEKPSEKPSEAKPVGDMAMAKPSEKTVPKATPRNEQNGRASDQHQRPRTLEEAKRRSGTLGQKMKQDGGTHEVASTSTLDVKVTGYGAYDALFVEAVKQCWYRQIEDHGGVPVTGKVVIQFRLHSDGSLTELSTLSTDVDGTFTWMCEQALRKPQPFEKWPTEMRREMGESRVFEFTFYY
jgi:hypothetical protein